MKYDINIISETCNKAMSKLLTMSCDIDYIEKCKDFYGEDGANKMHEITANTYYALYSIKKIEAAINRISTAFEESQKNE